MYIYIYIYTYSQAAPRPATCIQQNQLGLFEICLNILNKSIETLKLLSNERIAAVARGRLAGDLGLGLGLRVRVAELQGRAPQDLRAAVVPFVVSSTNVGGQRNRCVQYG